MKKLLILAAMLTAGAYSANAQTGTTTTTTRQTTTTPGTANPDQTVTPPATTTVESTTTSDANNTMSADTKGKGKTIVQPAPGTKVKGNGKRIKIK
jgi:hypothetical protein